MKTLRVTLALLVLAGAFVGAQDPVPVSTAPTETTPGVRRTAEQLEQLVAPIALYPDALLAIILPAATAPTDIVLAARQVRESPNDLSQIEHRAWDESVKSLTHYPDVLKWLDENLDWTKEVGEAFAEQPAEVMQAMQRLRAKARAAGTLVDTPQQQVIAEPDVIRIVPSQPDVIYVPYYEPEMMFLSRPAYYSRPFFSFGIGVPIGSWLAFDCDWRRNTIWVGSRHRPWTGHDWRRPLIAPGYVVGRPYARVPDVRQWRPSAYAPRRPVAAVVHPRMDVPRPAPISASFTRMPASRGNFSPDRRPSANPAQPATPATAQTFAPSSRGTFSQERRPAANPTQPANAASTQTSDSVTRGNFSRDRRPSANPTQPATPEAAQSVTPSPRGRSPGLRSLPADTAPQLATAPAVAPTVPRAAPTTPAPPQRASTERSSDNVVRNRVYRSSAPTPASTPTVVYAAPQFRPAPAATTTVSPQRPSARTAPPAPVAAPAPTVTQPSAPATTPAATPPPRNDRGGGPSRGQRDAS